MGFLDKLKNKAQQAKGRGKEEAGRQSGDPYLEAEGKSDRASGGAKQAARRSRTPPRRRSAPWSEPRTRPLTAVPRGPGPLRGGASSVALARSAGRLRGMTGGMS
ncbi:CsbD family protein [Actinomadura luteofluorescens]|uniref:CsbD family protein n=1 Tax=Actinomadura luteofluorescens TaxID=46163 RepID=UPI00364599EF